MLGSMLISIFCLSISHFLFGLLLIEISAECFCSEREDSEKGLQIHRWGESIHSLMAEGHFTTEATENKMALAKTIYSLISSKTNFCSLLDRPPTVTHRRSTSQRGCIYWVGLIKEIGCHGYREYENSSK